MPNCVMLLYTVVVTRFIGCVIRPNRFSNSRVEYRIAMTTGVTTQIVTQWQMFKIDKTHNASSPQCVSPICDISRQRHFRNSVGASNANTQCLSHRNLRKRTTAENRVVVRKQLHERPSLKEHQLKLLYHTVGVLSLQASRNGEPCRPAISYGNVMAAIDMCQISSTLSFPLAHFTGAGSIDGHT